MRRPLNGVPPITQVFGANEVDYSQFGLRGHHGVDYGVGTGTPVYAPESGRIEFSQNNLTDKYTGRLAAGETIVLNGKYEHWLMHLSRRLVSAGQNVSEGQLIGYSGATGYVTGPHLHWGVRPLKPNLNNGYRGFVDPGPVLFAPPAPQPAPQPPQGGSFMQPMSEAREAQLYQEYLGRPKEFAGASGRTEQKFFYDALGEIKVTRQSRAELEGKVGNLVGHIKNVETQLAELSKRPTHEEIATLKDTIAKATEQAEADRERAEQLQRELEEAKQGTVVDEQAAVKGFFSKLIDALYNLVGKEKS